MATLYFRTTEKRADCFGERYFKVNWEDDFVIQVMYKQGSNGGRGKKQAIGVYMVSKTTFISNYMSVNCVKATTKNVYLRKFDEVVKMIR